MPKKFDLSFSSSVLTSFFIFACIVCSSVVFGQTVDTPAPKLKPLGEGKQSWNGTYDVELKKVAETVSTFIKSKPTLTATEIETFRSNLEKYQKPAQIADVSKINNFKSRQEVYLKIENELDHNQKLLFFTLIQSSPLVSENELASALFIEKYVDESFRFGDLDNFGKAELFNVKIREVRLKKMYYFSNAVKELMFRPANSVHWANVFLVMEKPRTFLGHLLHVTNLIVEKKYNECVNYIHRKDSAFFVTLKNLCSFREDPVYSFTVDERYKNFDPFLKADFYDFLISTAPPDFFKTRSKLLTEIYNSKTDKYVLFKIFVAVYARKVLGEKHAVSVDLKQRSKPIVEANKSNLVSKTAQFYLELYESDLDSLDIKGIKNVDFYRRQKNLFFLSAF